MNLSFPKYMLLQHRDVSDNYNGQKNGCIGIRVYSIHYQVKQEIDRVKQEEVTSVKDIIPKVNEQKRKDV